MRYNFSAEFLRIVSPDTSFGDAWESLCYDLLVTELQDSSLQRIVPPDKGIDIWHRKGSSAYQCKSDERGALGSLSANDSVDSLKAAVAARPTLAWATYYFATNANYTGTAVKKLLDESSGLGIGSSQIQFHGPEYWSELCERHFERVAHRLDYRIRVTEAEVIEAFRKAGYYDRIVKEFAEKISKSELVLKIKNNWTPVELEIPFSPDLKVENCVDAVQELLGVSLKWTNFADLGTSTGPAVSLTVNKRGQTFSQTIGEVCQAKGEAPLEFWMTIRWKDATRDDGADARDVYRRSNLTYSFLTLDRESLSHDERKVRTVERAEAMLQTMIWRAASMLKKDTGLYDGGQ